MLRTDDHGRVRLLTLDRPDALNAFNDALYKAAASALDDAAADDGVAVVVLTGAGRAFSAGQDIGEMARPAGGSGGDSGGGGVPHGFPTFMSSIIGFPKPLIAAVNGLGVGVGMTMLPHCDLVLLSETARLRVPFASLGVVPEAAASVLLPMQVGWQKAAELLYTADWIDAATAVAHGLALRAVPPERLLDDALELAGRIAAMPIVSLVETKRLLRHDRDPLVHAARAREDEVFGRLIGGPANREAIAAFAEKRAPDFSKLGS
jgi:enoyl-CoA hydratase/carnithine racemase